MPENLTDSEEARLLDLSVLSSDKIALLTQAGTESALGTEVAGGGYARAAATFGAAVANTSGPSAGKTTKTVSAPHLYINMPACSLQGWAIIDGTTRKWYGLFQERVVSAAASTDLLTKVAHELTNGQKVVFQSGFAPAGLSPNVTYFVVNASADTFAVSATLGGSVLDITADMAAAVVGKVVDVAAGEVFAIPAGTLQLSLG